MPDNMPKDEFNTVSKYLPLYNKGNENIARYKGTWSTEELAREINEYFNYCSENELKTAKVGLQLWLGISRAQYYEWETKPEKYGDKSDLMKRANCLIEMSYVDRAEKYPTANLFLLKAGHGYKETVDVNVTSQNASKEDIGNAIANLGLDKPEE